MNTGGQKLGVVVTVVRKKKKTSVSYWNEFIDKTNQNLNLRSLAGSLSAAALDGNPMTLALEALGGDQTLDLGGLCVIGLALASHSAADDELADIVLLVKAEEATDLGSTLGAESLGNDGVSEAWELTLTLLDDAEGQDSQIGTGDG